MKIFWVKGKKPPPGPYRVKNILNLYIISDTNIENSERGEAGGPGNALNTSLSAVIGSNYQMGIK